ncbi:MAG: hypothetical protein Q8P52_01025 [bacterium]|nr:hypothetical protein [bacterium]
MSENVHIVYKNPGETPLECLKRFRQARPEYATEKITYAGRLDPLAEGLLILLSGEECKKKGRYLELSKLYEIEVLFSIKTDTYDLLGIVEEIGEKNLRKEEIKESLKKYGRDLVLPYPPYSSKTVRGQKLFKWARAGRLSEIDIPKRKMEIEKIVFKKMTKITSRGLMRRVERMVSLVKGDFRQGEVLKSWKKMLAKTTEREFQVVALKVRCASGTYMRSLANDLGERLGTGAIALSIKRTAVLKYKKR